MLSFEARQENRRHQGRVTKLWKCGLRGTKSSASLASANDIMQRVVDETSPTRLRLILRGTLPAGVGPGGNPESQNVAKIAPVENKKNNSPDVADSGRD